MEKTELMKRYEEETGHNAFLTYGITQAICYPTYVEWLEEQLSNQTVEKFQEIIRNQCDEISTLKEKAEAYDRLMSGGKKTLKEWANIFGMLVAVDRNGEAACFVHVPVMYLDAGEGIWANSPDHYGEEIYLLPPYLIDFDGDWKDSLTLPDGWEEE